MQSNLRSVACLLALSTLAGSLQCRAAAGADWNRWRGPALNGISAETGWSTKWPAEGPARLWKASVGVGFASVTVSGGRAYTTGNHTNRDTLFCLDAETGKVLWKHGYDCLLDPHFYDGGTSASPTVEEGRVYTMSRRGQVFCLEAGTGKLVWEANLPKQFGLEIPEWGFAGSPLVDGDHVYLNAGSAGTALNKATGKLVWTTGKEPSGYSSLVPFTQGGARLFTLATHQHIAAIEPASGRIVWRHPWKTEYDINAADPVVVGDRLFISSGYDHGGAVIRPGSEGVEKIWENKNLRTQFSTAVFVNGHLFGIDGNNGRACTLKCVDPATGNVLWSKTGTGMGSLMCADGKLIVQWEKGEVVVAEADPSGYRELSRAQLLGGKCWTQPVLSHGRLYCRNAAGDVACFDLRAK